MIAARKMMESDAGNVSQDIGGDDTSHESGQSTIVNDNSNLANLPVETSPFGLFGNVRLMSSPRIRRWKPPIDAASASQVQSLLNPSISKFLY